MNIESLRHNSKSKLFVLFMAIFALFLGYLSCKKPIVSIAMVVGTLYLICLSKKPMWAYFLMILTSIYFFGFVDDTFLSLPGAFKLRDICLLSLFFPLIGSMVLDKNSIKRTRTAFSKYLVLMMVFIAFIIFYTTYIFDVPIVSCLRLARKYIFYLSFFFLIYFIKDETDLKSFMKIMFIIAITQALLMIVQVALGPNIKLLAGVKMSTNVLQGLVVTRVRIHAASGLMTLFFAVSFWIYQCKKRNKIYLIIAMILGLGVFLEFYRTKWVKEFLIVFVPFLFTLKRDRKKFAKMIIAFSFAGFLFLIMLHFLGWDIQEKLYKVFLHAKSTLFDAINQSGTFSDRIQFSSERLRYFYERPLFGIGFLHYTSASSSSMAASITQGLFIEYIDSEICTILTTMGIAGAIVFSAISIAFLRRCTQVLKIVTTPINRGIILGCLGYFIGGLSTIITFSFFTYVSEIPFIAIAFMLVEKIASFEKNKLLKAE